MPRVKNWTPWGMSDYQEKIADGITFHGTPSHGGYKVSSELNAQIADKLKETENEKNGWYEEDCSYAKVIISFPKQFSPDQFIQAVGAMKAWYPHLRETKGG